MQTQAHKQHIAARVSHNACPECIADNQRSFVRSRPFRYDHVTEYLRYVRPRLAALETGKNGGNTVEAQWWYRDFITALNRRISSHVPRQGRKYSDGYLERLKMADVNCGPECRRPSADYLRTFAQKGASCL